MVNIWKRCPNCDKKMTCESNLWKLRGMVLGCTCGGFIAGSYLLSTAGFGDGGVTMGSMAAGWQSSIGNVPAHSLFAAMTSIGMTSTGTILFGGTSAALTLLSSVAIAKKLDWCTCKKKWYE